MSQRQSPQLSPGKNSVSVCELSLTLIDFGSRPHDSLSALGLNPPTCSDHHHPPPIKGWLGDFDSSLTFFTLGFFGKVTVLSLSLLPGLWSPRNRKSMALEPNKNGFQTSSVHFLLWDYTFELLQDYGEIFYMWNIYMYGGSETYLESSELFFFSLSLFNLLCKVPYLFYLVKFS